MIVVIITLMIMKKIERRRKSPLMILTSIAHAVKSLVTINLFAENLLKNKKKRKRATMRIVEIKKRTKILIE